MTGSIVEWTEDLPEIQVNSLYKFDLDTGGNKMACFFSTSSRSCCDDGTAEETGSERKGSGTRFRRTHREYARAVAGIYKTEA